jgi:serine/threonine-protein kinase
MLAADVRDRLAADTGDYIVTRPGTRAPSIVVDHATARLLERFRQPTEIAKAVVSEAPTPRGAERLLRHAFSTLAFCRREDLLVRPGRGRVKARDAAFRPGQCVDGFEILACVRALTDTEVYRARHSLTGRDVALKVARHQTAHASRAFEREFELLRAAESAHVARVFGVGSLGGRPYLGTEWCDGKNPVAVAAALRSGRRSAHDEQRLLALCRSVLRAYRGLHARGLLHGDVQVSNILITKRGTARLLDFGLAVRVPRGGTSGMYHRAGIVEFLDPEYADAVLRRARPPALSFGAEQYALAALLDLLLAGRPYIHFELDEMRAYRQIVESPPLSFAARNAEPWPAVEAVLRKALSKAPAERFASVQAFHRAFADIRATATRSSVARVPTSTSITTRAIEELGARCGEEIDAVWPRPFGSVGYGAAGGALALLHAACALNRADLLAAADVWSTKAIAACENDTAFTFSDSQAAVTRESLYYGRPGVLCARALVARALTNRPVQHEATRNFLTLTTSRFSQNDFTLGAAGIVHGCAMLLFTDGELAPGLRRELLAHGDGHLAKLWRRVGKPVPPDKHADQSTGLAHGRAGMLYATLEWSQVAGRSLPPSALEMLNGLLAAGVDDDGDLAWPIGDGSLRLTNRSWCAGNAGFIHLWSLAYEVTLETRFLDAAVRAAGRVRAGLAGDGGLCCGLTGRAYALLRLYRATNDAGFLRDAKRLAALARSAPFHPSDQYRLYRGPLGLATLEADLANPATSRMVFFELEVGR